MNIVNPKSDMFRKMYPKIKNLEKELRNSSKSEKEKIHINTAKEYLMPFVKSQTLLK